MRARVLQGEYRLMERLARRGEMTWWRACSVQDSRRRFVVVEVPWRLSGADARLARLGLEAASTPYLSAPAPLFRLQDFFPQEGSHFLIFRGDAVAMLGESPLAAADALRIARAVCAQLELLSVPAADVSPEAVLLDADGEPHLCGFGLARLLLPRLPWEPYRGMLGYAAPEQAGLVPQVSFRSDVYGVGTLLWRMLTGLHPALASPRYPGLVEVLEPDPVHRIPDARALAAHLDNVVKGDGVPRRTYGA